MKTKTSVTLDEGLLAYVDKVAGKRGRSAFIETVLKRHKAREEYDEIQRRDLEILNKHADKFNAEMEDILTDQADSFEAR